MTVENQLETEIDLAINGSIIFKNRRMKIANLTETEIEMFK